MEPLKPRDKVTQHMTRDGLTLDNQTTGESVNVSSREAEQEYTTQPEGAAEKILERADELHDRHKAKKVAKDSGETVAQATGPVSRLQFTAEERASPELAPYIKKAEKRADKLEAAKEALPKKRVVTKETVYDEAKGKAKSRLYFDNVEKAPPQLKPNPASRPIQEAGLYLHGKIHEVEHENVGVEGGHKGEELAERQAGRMIRRGVHRHKLKPYRAAAKAERKSIAANAEFGFGPERLKRLSDAYDATFMEYATVTLDDAKSDKQLWYTKGKVDQELKRICGEHFVPWEERYGH